MIEDARKATSQTVSNKPRRANSSAQRGGQGHTLRPSRRRTLALRATLALATLSACAGAGAPETVGADPTQSSLEAAIIDFTTASHTFERELSYAYLSDACRIVYDREGWNRILRFFPAILTVRALEWSDVTIAAVVVDDFSDGERATAWVRLQTFDGGDVLDPDLVEPDVWAYEDGWRYDDCNDEEPN